MARSVRTMTGWYVPAGQLQRASAWRKAWSHRQHNDQRLREARLETTLAHDNNKAHGPAELHSVHTEHSQGKPGASTTCNPSRNMRTRSIQNDVPSCVLREQNGALLDQGARSQQRIITKGDNKQKKYSLKFGDISSACLRTIY